MVTRGYLGCVGHRRCALAAALNDWPLAPSLRIKRHLPCWMLDVGGSNV